MHSVKLIIEKIRKISGKVQTTFLSSELKGENIIKTLSFLLACVVCIVLPFYLSSRCDLVLPFQFNSRDYFSLIFIFSFLGTVITCQLFFALLAIILVVVMESPQYLKFNKNLFKNAVLVTGKLVTHTLISISHLSFLVFLVIILIVLPSFGKVSCWFDIKTSYSFFSTFIIYFVLFTLISTSLGVVLSPHILHSLLFLIITFANSALLLILLKIEFFGLIFLVIYLGAITILFIFIIMMLNIRLIEFNSNLIKYLPIGTILTLTILIELILLFKNERIIQGINYNIILDNNINWSNILIANSMISTLGLLFYIYYWALFFNSAIVLLIAMIGVILITILPKAGVNTSVPLIPLSEKKLNYA